MEKALSGGCVGGGIAGVELGARLKDEHPDKKVTLIHDQEKLLHHSEGLHEVAAPLLNDLGVELQLNSKFTSGSNTEYDLVINCLPGEATGPKNYL